MEIDDDHDGNYLYEDTFPREERMSGGGTTWEVLTRVELDLAYSSEKVLILEILLMHVDERANDHEALVMDNEGISTESLANAFEFDLLSGILNSEVKELEGFMTSLQTEIVDARQRLSQSDFFGEASTEIEVKLQNAEESLKQSQVLLADLRRQSEDFERALGFGASADMETEDGHMPSMSSKMKLQTLEQQTNCLRKLEKSLARELDLEKQLSDSRYYEEELKMKLHYTEEEAYCMEETIEMFLERIFEAENAAELLLGISKELSGKIQIVQLNLSGALQREVHMNYLKEAEDKCAFASSEALTLREKVAALEKQLRESESQYQLENASVEASKKQQNLLDSELTGLKNVIDSLRENILETESRAESAEAKCTVLTKANKELSDELSFLTNNRTDKANILERKLKASDTQLEHAKASVEAIEEQQNLLYSALGDMENLIEDLKGKVSKAESRAESAESKYTLLTETNMELNEEVGFLRGRLERLETSLHQTDDAKIATAKDIGMRTKIITELVIKLALERERLQLQISALATKNKILANKCLKTKDIVPGTMTQYGTNMGNEVSILKSSEAEFSTTTFQVEELATVVSAHKTSLEMAVSSSDDSTGATSKIENMRTKEVTQPYSKYLFMTSAVVLVSIVTFYLSQLVNHYY